MVMSILELAGTAEGVSLAGLGKDIAAKAGNKLAQEAPSMIDRAGNSALMAYDKTKDTLGGIKNPLKKGDKKPKPQEDIVPIFSKALRESDKKTFNDTVRAQVLRDQKKAVRSKDAEAIARLKEQGFSLDEKGRIQNIEIISEEGFGSKFVQEMTDRGYYPTVGADNMFDSGKPLAKIVSEKETIGKRMDEAAEVFDETVQSINNERGEFVNSLIDEASENKIFSGEGGSSSSRALNDLLEIKNVNELEFIGFKDMRELYDSLSKNQFDPKDNLGKKANTALIEVLEDKMDAMLPEGPAKTSYQNLYNEYGKLRSYEDLLSKMEEKKLSIPKSFASDYANSLSITLGGGAGAAVGVATGSPLAGIAAGGAGWAVSKQAADFAKKYHEAKVRKLFNQPVEFLEKAYKNKDTEVTEAFEDLVTQATGAKKTPIASNTEELLETIEF